MKIKKAIIPAAGLGTRFLPATKAQPKEMLPVVDKPAIQFIIEEAVASGIEDILIITGRNKRAIEDHFDHSVELELILEQKGDTKHLEEIRRISALADIHYVRQKEAKGLGHAIYCGRKFIGNEPFAVLLGDDIVVNPEPCLKQLIHTYQQVGGNVIGIRPVPKEQVSSYGIVASKVIAPSMHQITDLVEKPALNQAPSNLAIMGRYILQPEIFDILAAIPPGRNGEIQLTDALKELLQHQSITGYEFQGKRYDVGDKLGFLIATVEIALTREEVAEGFRSYLKQAAARLFTE
ncbi:MAG TPA: UTP--glucose-1-phosphate uridylyltransferase GalU [Clostridia bacterium]|nr:UTP--glucose-1-phosphate uridylyltransferase GalU [Clostridia bacterium]